MPRGADGTFWTRHLIVMAWLLRELIDVVMCCTHPKRVSRIGTKGVLHIVRYTCHLTRIVFAITGRCSTWTMLVPIEGSPATGKSVAGIIHFFVDGFFSKGGTEMEQRVIARLKRISKLVQKPGMMCFSQDIN